MVERAHACRRTAGRSLARASSRACRAAMAKTAAGSRPLAGLLWERHDMAGLRKRE